ncbi:MAG: hypothetical protein ND866_28500 [Pyrinomonadaceae bacterium]|nr:hypothetical protein [Pyrinomonadaceae bacterium]
MKQQALRTLTVVSLLLTLAAVSARAQSAGEIRMEVPFDFYAGTQQFRAGEYTFRRDSKTGYTVLRVENRHSSASARLLTSRVQRPVQPERAQLVFQKYGEQYFLTQVWTGGEDAGRELNESKRERRVRELAKNAEKNKVAQGASKAETVVLTAGQQ